MRGLRELVEFFLPTTCLGCGVRMTPEESHRVWCGRCGARLRPPPGPGCPRCQAPLGTGAPAERPCRECAGWPPELMAAEAAVALGAPADRLVHGLKYEGWSVLASDLAERMEAAARRLLVRLEEDGADGRARVGTVVVPVATTTSRERQRGYNQAELVARCLAPRLGRPLEEALQRVDGGETQVALHPEARRSNVKRAFRCRGWGSDGGQGGRPGGPRPVLLIDDVLTTGATAEAAARALIEAGCPRVAVLTFARALPDPAPGRDVPEDPEALGELLDPVLPGAWGHRRSPPSAPRSGPHGVAHGDGAPSRRLHP